MISFLTQHIITKIGVLESLVFNDATYFSSLKIIDFALDKGIKLKYVTNYYPKRNGLAESTNKNLIRILKKSVVDHQ